MTEHDADVRDARQALADIRAGAPTTPWREVREAVAKSRREAIDAGRPVRSEAKAPRR